MKKENNKEEHHHDHDHSHHHHDEEFTKKKVVRTLIGIAFYIAAFYFGKMEMIATICFLIAYLCIGIDVLKNAITHILKGKWFDENFLMAIATIGAIVIGQYPEAVAVMLFYTVGEYFQALAVKRSRKSIIDLMDMKIEYAYVKQEEKFKKIKPEEVKIGQIILVKPGEKIPLDGIVIEGNSTLDTSSLTGESLPKEVTKGSLVLSGSVNKQGVLTIEITSLYKDSTVFQIMNLIEHASLHKSKTEKFITKFSNYYTPIVVLLSVLIFVIPTLLLTNTDPMMWLERALIFLVIACPCALVISIPLSFFGGIGAASRKGILIKGSNYLDALYRVNTIFFDKTGTLTKGSFALNKMESFAGNTNDEVIRYLAYAEYHSNHPLALCLRQYYKEEIEITKIEHYQEHPGYGISAVITGKKILAGNRSWMLQNEVSLPELPLDLTEIWLAVDGVIAGRVTFMDEIKPKSKETILALKKLGVKRLIMLTGDNQDIANSVSKTLGITKVYAELLPHQKQEKIKEQLSKKRNGSIVFVGDGMNDAPSLMLADVGISMGSLGSDAAIEASDIVIMNDEIEKIAESINLAKRTRAIVIQNISFALGIKCLFLVLGAFGVSGMWEAVFADVGVALLAIANALRLVRKDVVYK